ncbi:MAG: RNA polymerase sigma factor [Desulfobacterales bacterium]
MENQIKNLCRRAKKADKNAASELLKIYYADIYSYLRRLCGSKQDAEDLTQQTLLKVWSSLDGFKGRSKFSTWLYRIAHNTFLDWLRKNAAGTQSRPDQWWQECIDQNPGPFSNVAERQLAQRLYQAVDKFDEDKKHVVHLHYYQGLSLRETAKVLDIATSTVKYRLREVLKALRAKFDVQETEFEQKQTIPIAKGEPL